MSLPQNLQKGDPLLLVSDGREEKTAKVTVARVGRAYVYVVKNGWTYEDDTQYDRTTGVAKENVGWKQYLVTPEQYAEMQEREQLLASLQEAGVEIGHRHQETIPLAKLSGLLTVMQTGESS
ncbi:hypothetical protein AB0E08_07590 [Streptomyces sp. NPDC048281]|uniref:beta barrel domain-containing protein n=1 Tax=Streptomyces sp. NPDC048281 TaxID=3154715 RepID=UPI003419144A